MANNRPVYLALIWHQHQPLYIDSQRDCLIAPWVRTHGTKDYYDMAAMIERYPNVHCTINLTTSLLKQLQNYYVDRLAKCIDPRIGKIDLRTYLAEVQGRTDPWIDLLIKPTEEFDDIDRDYLYRNPWSCLSISEVVLERFPEYEQLKFLFKNQRSECITPQEMRELKFWFFLANFDPDFLHGPVNLPSGEVCDLSDLVVKRSDGKYYLCHPVTEDDCRRLLVEVYKVLCCIIPIHQKLRYHPETQEGQIEIITTPYTHPILPLLYNSDIARICQPNDVLPLRFSFPQDAEMQVKKAVEFYRNMFGASPVGMWPAEGSVSQDVIPLFARNGIRWIATDKQILARSAPQGQSHLSSYCLYTEWADVAIFFRDTQLSDRVGFTYQTMKGEEASDDFIRYVLQCAAKEEEKLITVILDGENAWEWYRCDHDGKNFLHSLYRKLERLYETGQIVTVTPAEYLLGNSTRGVPAHPPSTLPKIEKLWPGSWINANFDTWVGEEEENIAWSYLLQTRTDLERAGISPPQPSAEVPQSESSEWFAYQTWEAMYAAEGSDWFWWYGEDQNAPGGDKPFDDAYLTHLQNVYTFAKRSGAEIPDPQFKPILRERTTRWYPSHEVASGVMAKGARKSVRVLFRCKIPDGMRPNNVSIVGNRIELGGWIPNKVPMYDDGTHGDEHAGDGIWSLELELPANAEIHYKYTHSGTEGHWEPGDEAPGKHRTLVVQDSKEMIVNDIFGKLETDR